MFKNAKTLLTATWATLFSMSAAQAEIFPLQTNQKLFCGIENSIIFSSDFGSALMVSGTGNFPGFSFQLYDNMLRMWGVEKNRGVSGKLTVTEYGQSKTYTIERSPPPAAPYTLKDIELTIQAGHGVDLSELIKTKNSDTFDNIWPSISPDFAKETRIIVDENTSSEDLGRTTGTYFTAFPTTKGGVFEVEYSSIVNLFPTIAESNCTGSAISSGNAKIRITVEPATSPPEPETPEETACKPMPLPANGAKFVFRYPTACSKRQA
ncbi:hypothetical protein [Brucella intermedia]|uniref:hypothetical protein n=1 Tax=Brucella intermedia TaxID=94625 RepID=UPI00244EC9DD|nr:hypothetical protein [Brucella intermedia]WGJ06615.1 hypothetical protein QBQ48_12255 [Brucella intermedia]